MNEGPDVPKIQEDHIIRLRAKMEDNTYEKLELEGGVFIVFRVPGENIDLLRSLEYLSEFLSPETLSESSRLIILSDRNVHSADPSILAPKLEETKNEDDQLYEELKNKIRERLKPLIFTTQNDILELYRAAIRIDGSIKRPDKVVGQELIRTDLPEEGEVVYLVFDDGYRKMTRNSYQKLIDDAMKDVRGAPSLASDKGSSGMSKESRLSPSPVNRSSLAMKPMREVSGPTERSSFLPELLLKDFIKNMTRMGYREDVKFSRHDANQTFLVGMNGPAIFYKVLLKGEDMSSFLRVLDHRSDALGVLINDSWNYQFEARSRVGGFIYLSGERAWKAHDVVREVIRGGHSP
ncbi:MAG: hypothetical protein ACMUIG_02415 [Thermoplasmatota archaeon]